MLLNLESVPHFYKNYVKLIEDTDMLQALRVSGNRMQELVYAVPADRIDFQYGPEKWSIRELLCHVIDTERIFSYRALCFARGDKTNLPGFDEKQYAPEANAANRSLKSIADEMRHLRISSIDLFSGFTEEMLKRKGVANDNELAVIALGFIIAGHETHHRKILEDRYFTAWRN
jgi:DinB superfamily